MKLKEYLKSKKMKVREFAELTDLSRCNLHMVMSGMRKPGRKQIKTIVNATEGQVTAEDLLEPYKKLIEN